MALTKADMAEKLFEELGLNKREAKEMVERLEEVRMALEQGEQVKLSGFGNFDSARRSSGQAGTRRRGKKYRSRRVAW